MKPITLITGAAKGLGFATARILAQAGHHVLIGARDATRGEAAAAQLRAEGGTVDFVLLDVTNEASISATAQIVAERHGHLDHLINNAAVLLDHYGDASATTTAQLLTTLNTNVIGIHAMLVAFVPLLKQAVAARIINISSGGGQLNDMFGTVWAPAYQVSKTAVNALTNLWATELQSCGIPVNSICPGWCRTDMGGETATRSPEEGAADIAWHLTDAPREWTGKFYRQRAEIPW